MTLTPTSCPRRQSYDLVTRRDHPSDATNTSLPDLDEGELDLEEYGDKAGAKVVGSSDASFVTDEARPCSSRAGSRPSWSSSIYERLRFLAMAIVLLLGGCSDAFLYGVGQEDPRPTDSGSRARRTDDAARRLPVKVIFLADVSNGPLFAWDSEQVRSGDPRRSRSIRAPGLQLRRDLDERHRSAPRAVEGLLHARPGRARRRGQHAAVPQPCIGTVCRDYDGASLAQIIEGDLADLYAGERSRTQYVIVSMMGGPPDPLCWEIAATRTTRAATRDSARRIRTARSRRSATRSALRDEVQEAGAVAQLPRCSRRARQDRQDVGPLLDWTETLLGEMAFAGAGTFERFDVADAITLDRVGLLKLTSLLEAKTLMVVNRNTLPTIDGPVMDSDGDGCRTTTRTRSARRRPTRHRRGRARDQVELLLSLEPADAREGAAAGVRDDPGPPYEDSDFDTLNDCEACSEPRRRSPTRTATACSTGSSSSTERTTCGTTASRLRFRRLHERRRAPEPHRPAVERRELAPRRRVPLRVTDEGFVSEPTVFGPNEVTGVTILEAGPDTVGGLGTLHFIVGSPPSLAWQDAADDSPGAALQIEAPGNYTLDSSSVATEGAERWLKVDVEPSLFPPTSVDERLLVELSERHCVSFTVRNIRLMETVEDGGDGGMNNVYIYFAEAPKDRLFPGCSARCTSRSSTTRPRARPCRADCRGHGR